MSLNEQGERADDMTKRMARCSGAALLAAAMAWLVLAREAEAACNLPDGVPYPTVDKFTVSETGGGSSASVTSTADDNPGSLYLCNSSTNITMSVVTPVGLEKYVGWIIEAGSSSGMTCDDTTTTSGSSMVTPSEADKPQDNIFTNPNSKLKPDSGRREFFVKLFCDGNTNGVKDSYEPYICHSDPAGEIYEIKVALLNVDLAIYRMDGTTQVAEDKDHTEGSITRVLNPNEGETIGTGKEKGISLKLKPSVSPTGLPLTYKLRLKEIHTVANDKGLVRVYQDSGSSPTCIINNCPPASDDEEALSESELADDFWMEFEGGGIMEFELAAFSGSTEICKNSVRACAIPCTPKPGGVLFVNPGTPAGSSLNDYTDDSAVTIAAALAAACDDMNVVVSSTTYAESGLQIDDSITLAGLGLRWIDNPNVLFEELVDWTPQFLVLPLIQPRPKAQILDIKDNGVRVGGFLFKDGAGRGGAIKIEGQDDFHVCCAKCQYGEGAEGAGLYFGAEADDWGSREKLSVVDCAFVDNTASVEGGGIGIRRGKDVLVQRTLFEGNSVHGADEDTLYRGGAIFSFKGEGTFKSTDCLFWKNKAIDAYSGSDADWSSLDTGAYGGAVSLWQGDPVIRFWPCHFVANECRSTARRARGGAVSIRDISSRAGFIGAVALQNVAEGARRGTGGVIDLFTASAGVIDSRFEENRVAEGTGKLPANIPELEQPASVHQNHVPETTSYGGAIALHHGRDRAWPAGPPIPPLGPAPFGGSSLTVDNSKFLKNFSGTCGGAVGIVGESEAITGEASAGRDVSIHEVRISGSLFKDNSSRFHGGALACASMGSRLTLERCEFVANKALNTNWIDADGAAIAYQVARMALVKDCLFEGNESGDSGACKHGGLAKAVYNNCVFTKNIAHGTRPSIRGGGCGGAMRLSTMATAILENGCQFSENTAADGGSISCEDSRVIIKDGGTMRQNSARRNGGAFHLCATPTGNAIPDWLLLLGYTPAFKVFGTTGTPYDIEDNDADGFGGAGAAETARTSSGILQNRRSDGSVYYLPWPAVEISSLAVLREVVLYANSAALSYDTGRFSRPIAGLCIVTDVGHEIDTRLEDSIVMYHDGFALLHCSLADDTSDAKVSVETSAFSCNEVNIFSQHADLACDYSSYSLSDGEVGIGVGGLPGYSYDQTIRVNSSDLCANAPGAIGVVASHPIGVGPNESGHALDIEIRQSSFRGLQAPAPDPSWGAILVNPPVPSTPVDAANNYWDHVGGPNDPTARNPSGSFVSFDVDFGAYLPSAP
jgi:hypothetical protein